MRIAVLMSTYNGKEYIKEQIDSILNQKGEFSLDLLVRDDGSTDGTLDILNDYSRLGKLRWVKGENVGPAKSFIDLLIDNKGYDFYAFSDQDDVWNLDKIDRALIKIGGNLGPCLYCSNAELVDANLNSFGRNVYKQYPKLDLCTITCAGGALGCTMVFNKSLAEIVWMNSAPKKMVLHDFYMAVLCKAVGGKIIYDDYASMKYRQHGNNVVGVAATKKNIMNSRIKSIMCKKKVGIAEQCEDILRYSMADSSREWIEKVSMYKKNFIHRLALASSGKTHYINRNMSVKIRLSILFGNR